MGTGSTQSVPLPNDSVKTLLSGDDPQLVGASLVLAQPKGNPGGALTMCGVSMRQGDMRHHQLVVSSEKQKGPLCERPSNGLTE
jgi:hypothetical protein